MNSRRRVFVLAGMAVAVVIVGAVVAGTLAVMDDSDDDFAGDCRRITYDERAYYSVGRAVDRTDLVAADDPMSGEGPRSCDPGAMETMEFRPAHVRHIPGVDPTRAVVARYDLTDDSDALYVADEDYGRTGELPDDLADALTAAD